MKNQSDWKPTKYALRHGRLRASRDHDQVSVSSRLIADRVAALYDAHLKTYAKGDLIDLGCGYAPLYLAYGDLVSSVTCVDWQHSLHHNPHLDIEADLNAPLPLDDGVADTVILSDVLEHIRKPEALLGEITRILRPGGHLLLNVPFMYWLHEQPHDYYRYTEHALRSFVTDAGLDLLHIETVGGALDVLCDTSAKLAFRLPGIGAATAIGIQGLARGFGATGFGHKVRQRSAEQFPLGYFLVAEKA